MLAAEQLYLCSYRFICLYESKAAGLVCNKQLLAVLILFLAFLGISDLRHLTDNVELKLLLNILLASDCVSQRLGKYHRRNCQHDADYGTNGTVFEHTR